MSKGQALPISLVVYVRPTTHHGTSERLEFDIISRRESRRCRKRYRTSREQEQLQLHRGGRGAWLYSERAARFDGVLASTSRYSTLLGVLSPKKTFQQLTNHSKDYCLFSRSLGIQKRDPISMFY